MAAKTGWYIVISYSGSQQPFPFRLPVANPQQAAAQDQVTIANPVDHPGPYPTKAAAQAAIGGHGSSRGNPPSSGTGNTGTWWVVIPAHSLTMKVIESATKPTGYSTVFGPYSSKAEADQVAGKLNVPPHGIDATPSLPSGLTAIGDFFSKLGEASTWIRVAEVGVGILLIGIGVSKLTGVDNKISELAKNIKVIPI